MLSQSDLNRCAEELARELLEMSYDQLERVYEHHRENPDLLARSTACQGEWASIGITLARFGLIRERISIEVVATPAGDSTGKLLGCAYYERFRSGKVYKPGDRETLILIAIIFGLGTVGLVVLIYHLLKLVL